MPHTDVQDVKIKQWMCLKYQLMLQQLLFGDFFPCSDFERSGFSRELLIIVFTNILYFHVFSDFFL